MADISLVKTKTNKKFTEENSFNENNHIIKKERKLSTDSNFDNLNAEIKSFIENEVDISFSNDSNSESQSPQIKMDYLFDSKFWRTSRVYKLENENEIFTNKNNILFLNENENEKELIKDFKSNKNYKRDSEGSNKQSTQSNESRIEHFHNNSDIESNNSPLNSLSNNESDVNEINCDKLPDKNITKEKEENKNNLVININNIKDENNNILNDNLNIKNDLEFIIPYEPIKYIQNQNDSNPFFQSYLNQPFCPFNNNYNLPSPINRRIITYNNNIINNNSCQNYEQEKFKNENNGKNNKYVNFNLNDYNKILNQNQKVINDLPLIINKNNSQNISENDNIQKLNLNMSYYPIIQNCNNSNSQTFGNIKYSSDYLPEFNNVDNSEKKIKNNILNKEEQKPISNNIPYNNKNKMNYKNNITNKNMNNNIINKNNLKGEKQILNLDDIVTGKDTRTTIMIRNIPIKYTDEILIESLSEFDGKYDCLYMPYDYEKNGNKGYAFINFVNPLHILYFYEKFNGKKWAHFESSKICELNCAHFQGINEIQKHAKNFKDLKKSCFNSSKDNSMIIPSKYLFKLKKRFPKIQYNENKVKKILMIKSFE